jgi:hypothetical protein
MVAIVVCMPFCTKCQHRHGMPCSTDPADTPPEARARTERFMRVLQRDVQRERHLINSDWKGSMTIQQVEGLEQAFARFTSDYGWHIPDWVISLRLKIERRDQQEADHGTS